MSFDVNRVTLVGRITENPTLNEDKELKYTFLSVATTKDNEVTIHVVLVKDSLSKHAVNYLSEGSRVYIEGSLKTWPRMEIIATRLIALTNGNKESNK